MAEVKSLLRVIAHSPPPDLVAQMEELLLRVKRGEVTAIASVLTYSNGDRGNGYSLGRGAIDVPQMLVELEVLKWKLIQKYNQDSPSTKEHLRDK